MAAPLKNEFWKARSTHGRAPIFKTPKVLLDAATEYFQWVEDNPLYEDTIIAYQGKVQHVPIAKRRAMTLDGLCLFLDIDVRTWRLYREREDFIPTCTRMESVIRNQKFEGAASGFFNPSIIARDLGLSDKSELTGKDGAPLVAEVNPKDVARQVAFFLATQHASEAEEDA